MSVYVTTTSKMGMTIITGDRGSGKTSALIRRCAENKDAVIIAPDQRRAYHIAERAKAMGVNIREPMTFKQFTDDRWHWAQMGITAFLFDDLFDSLHMIAGSVPIEAAVLE